MSNVSERDRNEIDSIQSHLDILEGSLHWTEESHKQYSKHLVELFTIVSKYCSINDLKDCTNSISKILEKSK